MGAETIQKLIDRAVGTKGTLRIPAWWMHKILSDLVQYSKTLEFSDAKIKEYLKSQLNLVGDAIEALDARVLEVEAHELFAIVSKRPSKPKENTIYLVPSTNGEGSNILTEWVYVNNAWEQFGEFKADVDLSGYVKKEDGKGLSTNDYTDEDKEKLDSLENYDDTALKEAIAKKADKDGVYPDMSVGKSANLLGVADGEEAEFLFRATDGDGSIKDGFASIERIEGSSVVWNQKFAGGFVGNGASIIDTDNGVVIMAYSTFPHAYIKFAYIQNHKYLYSAIATLAHADMVVMGTETAGNAQYRQEVSKANTPTAIEGIVSCVSPASKFYIFPNWKTDALFERLYTFENIRIIDLTQMFGSGNEPTTIEEFYARIPQGVDLNAYNQGEVINMSADSIKTIGFNAWDEEWESGNFDKGQPVPDSNIIRSKNFIQVLPNTSYHSTQKVVFSFYDAEYQYISSDYSQDTTTPSNAMYMKFAYGGSVNPITTYNHDICIHLVHTGYRNGEYEPYVSNEKALPIADYFPNGMNAIGDVKDELTPTEAIQRIGVVDMGSLDWAYSSGNISKFSALMPSDARIYPSSVLPNLMTRLYDTKINNANLLGDKNIYRAANFVGVLDSTYTDAATFKTAMQGVMLYYELAEPIVTKIDTPLDLTYPAWDFGTEEIIADTPTTPFKGSIIYEFNARDTIRANKKAIEGMAIEDYADGKLKVSINGVSKDFMAATPSGDPMHYMYVTAGAEYNDTGADIARTGVYGDTIIWKAGYWWLNELGDITNEEMKIIYSYRYAFPSANQVQGYYSAARKARTPLIDVPARASAINASYFVYSTSFETIALSQSKELVYMSNMTHFMSYSIGAAKIINGLDLTWVKSAAAMENAFLNAAKLIEVRLYLLPVSVEFAQSSLLSNASILYMIENEAATSAIVITLHADAYARAMADEAITAALEAHPNVSLASA